MQGNIDFILRFICFSDIIFKGMGLQCWKCVAHDCEMDPEVNYKATKVNCKDGEQCMKVRYKMFDNVTHYDSVIRTCTNNPCTSPSIEEFLRCVATPKLYMIGGCSLRSCCKNRDLCNSGRSGNVKPYTIILIILLLNI